MTRTDHIYAYGDNRSYDPHALTYAYAARYGYAPLCAYPHRVHDLAAAQRSRLAASAASADCCDCIAIVVAEELRK